MHSIGSASPCSCNFRTVEAHRVRLLWGHSSQSGVFDEIRWRVGDPYALAVNNMKRPPSAARISRFIAKSAISFVDVIMVKVITSIGVQLTGNS